MKKKKKDASPFAPIEAAVEAFRDGRMLIVVDDEDRENEGDLTIAAEKVTPDVINFMARYGRGLICLPMTGERLDALRIPLMVRDENNDAKFGTAFCVPIEAKRGTTTGISAADRAQTILTAIDEQHLSSVEEVGVALRAGTNCGSCRPALARLIETKEPIYATG